MTSAREGGGRQRVQGLQALLLQYLRQKRQCLRQYLHSEPKGLGQCPKQSTDPSASGTPKDPCLFRGAHERLGTASQHPRQGSAGHCSCLTCLWGTNGVTWEHWQSQPCSSSSPEAPLLNSRPYFNRCFPIGYKSQDRIRGKHKLNRN